jgi:hypothetical protein
MKRINIAGLCLMAALTFSVLGVATAQAANPEYGQCVGGQKKGNYTEAQCKTVAVKIKTSKGKVTEIPDHKGAFEWEAAPVATCVAVKKGFYSDSECTTRDESKGKPKGKFEKACAASCAEFKVKGGAATFYNFHPENESEPTKTPQGVALTSVGGTVHCTGSSGTGEFRNPRFTVEEVTFTGCASGGDACTSSGEATGSIHADLHGFLRMLQDKEVGLHLASGEEIVFTCGAVTDDLESGGVLGVVAGNVNTPSTTSTDTWAVTSPSEGVERQRYWLEEEIELEGGPFEHWESVITNYEGSHEGAFIATGLETTMEVTSEASQQVRS